MDEYLRYRCSAQGTYALNMVVVFMRNKNGIYIKPALLEQPCQADAAVHQNGTMLIEYAAGVS